MAMLGRVALQPGAQGSFARYRLGSLSEALTDPERLFPVTDNEYPADQVRCEYQTLWQGFLSASASWRDSQRDPVEHVDALLELLMDFQWCLPASTRAEELPDVSLFEHGKGVAAIASALYQFQQGKANLLDDLGHDEECKFLLCGCDISGIQNFIYQISSKGAYRHLKGRSFYIQLLAEVVARELLAAQRLTGTNLLYASAQADESNANPAFRSRALFADGQYPAVGPRFVPAAGANPERDLGRIDPRAGGAKSQSSAES
jgi:CRISPR-associated protein Csm1